MLRLMWKAFKLAVIIGGLAISLVAVSFFWIHQSSRGKIYRSSDKVQAKYTGILLGSFV